MSPSSTARSVIIHECVEALNAPLLVCEAVLTEASYLLSRFPKAQDTLLELVESGTLAVAFRVEGHVDELRKLLHKSATRRCRSLTPVSCAWPRCTTATPS